MGNNSSTTASRSMWDDDPVLEPAADKDRTPDGGFTNFGHSWVQGQQPPEDDRTNANASRARNLASFHGIAAPQLLIEEPEPKRRRNRDWDRSHRKELLRFSSFPASLHEKVLGLSEEVQATVGTTARLLLEYGLSSVEDGFWEITPELSHGTWTLFPKTMGEAGWSKDGVGLHTKRQIKSRKKGKGGKPKKDGTLMVGYREIPADVQSAIRKLAETKGVPVSEIGRFLMERALEDYESGVLQLAIQ